MFQLLDFCDASGELFFISPSLRDDNVTYQQTSTTLSTRTQFHSSLPTTTDFPGYGRRQRGDIASEAQILSACANNDSLVLNGGFELVDSTSSAFFWDVTLGSSNMIFNRLTTNTSQQLTPNGTSVGRVTSLEAEAKIRISQAITLCPNTNYTLTVWDRQPRSIAQCRAQYSVGNETIITAQAETMFRSREASFISGPDAQAVSVDLSFEVQCIGSQGYDGRSTWELDDISLTWTR